jgi:hypothetical protein
MLAAGRRFGRYKTEGEKAVRKADVKEDLVLQQFRTAWRSWIRDEFSNERDYDQVLALIRDIRYSAEDVEKFSLALAFPEFQDKERFSSSAGLFLSVVINNGDDQDYIIHTRHLQPIDFFGFRNRKNIIVEGDIGSWLGSEMKSGSITVKGDAKRLIGNRMEGGTITVKGCAAGTVGRNMKGGTIVIEGDGGYDIGEVMEGGSITILGMAGHDVGCSMRGGSIYLEADYAGISDQIFGGRIYHRGKLIFGW